MPRACHNWPYYSELLIDDSEKLGAHDRRYVPVGLQFVAHGFICSRPRKILVAFGSFFEDGKSVQRGIVALKPAPLVVVGRFIALVRPSFPPVPDLL